MAKRQISIRRLSDSKTPDDNQRYKKRLTVIVDGKSRVVTVTSPYPFKSDNSDNDRI